MGLDAGYYYMTIGGFTPELNPTRDTGAKANKKIVNVVTLTQTVKQHWQKKKSDKYIELEWDVMSKTDVDALVALDEAVYTTYSYTDVYGASSEVIIASFSASRLGTVDADGFLVQMKLEVVS